MVIPEIIYQQTTKINSEVYMYTSVHSYMLYKFENGTWEGFGGGIIEGLDERKGKAKVIYCILSKIYSNINK